MKKTIASVLLGLFISSAVLAGDIPGSTPCTANCPTVATTSTTLITDAVLRVISLIP